MASTPTSGDDVVFGTTSGDTIDALGGDDSIFGGDGNDALRGGSGADTLYAGAGLDILNGGRFGPDTASYAFSTSGVIASLASGFGYMVDLGEAADKDRYFSIENLEGGLANDLLYGNEFNNRLRGNNGVDQLFGFGGDDDLSGGNDDDYLTGEDGKDTISGDAGNDRINGGADADVLIGGSGTDSLLYEASDAGVTVDLAANTATGGHATGDTITGFENVAGSQHADILRGNDAHNDLGGGNGADVLVGRGGNDELFGEAGADDLRGGAGEDFFLGGNGADTMSGGDDGDFFAYFAITDSGTAAGARDIITDFEQGLDIIDIAQIDANPGTVTEDAFAFIGTDSFSNGTAGEVRYFFSRARPSSSFAPTAAAVPTCGSS